MGIRADLPFGAGWKVEVFSAIDLAWHSASPNGERLTPDAARVTPGLYRFSLRHLRHVLHCSKDTVFRVPGQVGKYIILRRKRRQVLRYRAEDRLLTVPAACRPPFLVERALIMCLGVPPVLEPTTELLHYTDVPRQIAATAAVLLRQTLQ